MSGAHAGLKRFHHEWACSITLQKILGVLLDDLALFLAKLNRQVRIRRGQHYFDRVIVNFLPLCYGCKK